MIQPDPPPFDTASAIQTVPGFGEDIVRNICDIVSGLVAPLVDTVGNPMPVRVDAAFADDAASYPQVAVRVRLGTQLIDPGDNIMSADRAVGGFAYYGADATDSQVIFDIFALSDAQRQYLLAYLRWGMQTAYSVSPTTGAMINAVVLKLLDDAGARPKRFAPDQTPDPRLLDKRPYGQIYRATLTLVADTPWSATAPLTPYPPIGIQVTATPDSGMQGLPLYLPGQIAPVPSLTDPVTIA